MKELTGKTTLKGFGDRVKGGTSCRSLNFLRPIQEREPPHVKYKETLDRMKDLLIINNIEEPKPKVTIE